MTSLYVYESLVVKARCMVAQCGVENGRVYSSNIFRPNAAKQTQAFRQTASSGMCHIHDEAVWRNVGHFLVLTTTNDYQTDAEIIKNVNTYNWEWKVCKIDCVLSQSAWQRLVRKAFGQKEWTCTLSLCSFFFLELALCWSRDAFTHFSRAPGCLITRNSEVSPQQRLPGPADFLAYVDPRRVAALRKVRRKTTLTWRTCVKKKKGTGTKKKKTAVSMRVLCPLPTPAHVCVSTRGERTLLGWPARLPKGNIFRIMACYCFGNNFFLNHESGALFLKAVLLARRDRSPVSPGGFYCSCTAFGAVSKDRHSPRARIIQACNWLIVSWDRHGRLRIFSVALTINGYKCLEKKERKRFHILIFTFSCPNNFLITFTLFLTSVKCKAIQIEESSKLALINLPL